MDPPDYPWSTVRRFVPTARPRVQQGQQNQTISPSRGGPATKIHVLRDGEGRRHALMLIAGQVHDIHGGRALLTSVPPLRRLMADKAYDANDLRDFVAA